MEAEVSEPNKIRNLGVEDLSPNFSLSPPTPVSPDYHIQGNGDLSGHNGNLCSEGLTLPLSTHTPPDHDHVGNVSYWKERYEILDGQLRTFRQQALKIRHVLANRLQELEKENSEAKSAARRADTEIQNLKSELKQQRNSRPPDATVQCEAKEEGKTLQLREELRKKEEEIAELQEELVKQETVHQESRAAVEKKVDNVKSLVAETISELETELSSQKEDFGEAVKMISVLHKILQAHQIPCPVILNSENKWEWSLPIRNSSLTLPLGETYREQTERLSSSKGTSTATEAKFNAPDDRRMSVPCQIPEPVEADDPIYQQLEEGEPALLDSNTWPRTRSKEDDTSVDVSDFIPYHLLSSTGDDQQLLDRMSENVKELIGAVCPMSMAGEYLPEVLPCDQESWFGDSLSTELLTPGASLDINEYENLDSSSCPDDKASTGNGPAPADDCTRTHSVSKSYVPSLLSTIADSVAATATILDHLSDAGSIGSYDTDSREVKKSKKESTGPVLGHGGLNGDDRRGKSHDYSSADDGSADRGASSCSLVSGDFTPVNIADTPGVPLANNVIKTNGHSNTKHTTGSKSENPRLPLASVESLGLLSSDGSSGKEEPVIAKVRDGDPNPWDADYDEPPEETPDDFFSKDGVNPTSKTNLSIRGRAAPPPLPQHKTSTVEKRIYDVAESGIRMSTSLENLMAMTRKSSCATHPASKISSIGNLYKDISVPVFTSVKGRVTMIRAAPFSGDSSDSSDDEHGTPKKSPQHRLGGKMLNALLGNKSNKVTVEPKKDEPDYEVPPDALEPSEDTDDQDRTKKLGPVPEKSDSERTPTTDLNSAKYLNRKSGWLTKLGGRVKTWKKRWFVLNEKEFQLMYFKSVNDTQRKPRGQIALDASCRITSWDQSATFELTTSKRTFYLTAESQEERKSWINAIQKVLKRFKSPSTVAERSKFIFMQGWVSRINNEKKFRCWCILSGSKLHFFRDSKGKAPFESVDMEMAKVHKLTEWDEEKLGKANGADYEKTVTLTTGGKTPKTIVMLFNSKEGKDNWFLQLKLASGETSSPCEAETEFETLSNQIVNGSGGAGTLWKNPVMCANKGSLEKPLTSLPTDALRKEAMKLAKTCSLFISVPKDKPAIDYHVTLVQNALQSCLSHPVLRNEMFCQLIKQTNPGQIDPGEHSIKQAWQLLCVTVSSFLPQHNFFELFRMHLERCSTPKTEVGRYAIYCQRMIQRVKQNGIRETHPSNLEILSIIQRHPYQHMLPLSIPVHLKNDSYQVVSFDGSSTVREFLKTLNNELVMRDCSLSGFSLFTDDPFGGELLHCLPLNIKICDVVSKWEQTAKESRSAKKAVNRMMRLTYSCRLYYPNNVASETEKERHLLAFQTMEDIVEGRFPVNKELALELAAVMAQAKYGDYPQVSNKAGPSALSPNLKLVTERFYPKRYKPTTEETMKQLCDQLREKWATLKHKPPSECMKIFLNVCRRWPFFGAKLFSAKYKSEDISTVWLAVQDSCINFLDYKTLRVLRKIPLKTVITFGGIKDDFMLVIRQPREKEGDFKSEKIILNMTKPKILEMIGLIASYMQQESADHGNKQTGSHTIPKMIPPKTLSLKQVSTVDRKPIKKQVSSPMM